MDGLSTRKSQYRRRASGFISLAFAAAVTSSFGATQAFAAEYTMGIAHLLPEDMENEVHPALTHFKSLVEAGTKGAVEVQLFGGGQLGSEVETAKQAQDGMLLQSSVISSGAMSSFYKKYQVVTAPFLFPDYHSPMPSSTDLGSRIS